MAFLVVSARLSAGAVLPQSQMHSHTTLLRVRFSVGWTTVSDPKRCPVKSFISASVYAKLWRKKESPFVLPVEHLAKQDV